MNNNGVDFVLLVKEMIYFYYGEIEAYEENDKQIEEILSNYRKYNIELTLKTNIN